MLNIGTHDIQNITVKSDNGIYISLDFIDGSNALGALIVAYSLTDDSDIHYSIIIRQNKTRILSPLVEFSNTFYNLSTFVITENGLPFTRTAALPKVLLNNNNSEGKYYYQGLIDPKGGEGM